MKIRPATAEDVPQIQALFRQLDACHRHLHPEIFSESDPGTETDARPVREIIEWMESDRSDYLVAEEANRVSGFLSLRAAHYPDLPLFVRHPFAKIDSMVVEDTKRGIGIGKQLFQAAIDWTKRHGMVSIQTTVWTGNTVAHRFYLEQGFSAVTQKLEWKLEAEDEGEPGATGEVPRD